MDIAADAVAWHSALSAQALQPAQPARGGIEVTSERDDLISWLYPGLKNVAFYSARYNIQHSRGCENAHFTASAIIVSIATAINISKKNYSGATQGWECGGGIPQ